MPSKSPAQHRLMEAAAHTPGGYDGVSQSVGREFTAADRGSPKSREDHMRRKAQHMTHAEVAADFGKHRTTVGRSIKRGG